MRAHDASGYGGMVTVGNWKEQEVSQGALTLGPGALHCAEQHSPSS